MTPLDATASRAYATCPRKFFLRHRQHLVKPQEEAGPAATFGIAWHSAQDAVWPVLCKDGSGSVEAAHKAGMDAFFAAWAAAKQPWSVSDLKEDEDRIKAQKFYYPATFEAMLFHYIERHAATLKSWTLLAIELPLQVPLEPDHQEACPNCDGGLLSGMVDITGATLECLDCNGTGTRTIPGELYCGLIDKVIRTAEGHIVPVDHKTTSKYAVAGFFRQDFLSSFEMSAQLIGYVYACSLLYDQPVSYALIDASLAHKTAHEGHRMLPYTITPPQINAWLKTQHKIVNRIAASDVDGEWEQSGLQSGACMGDYYPCAYFDLCQNGFDTQSGRVPPSFEVREWTPIKAIDASSEKE